MSSTITSLVLVIIAGAIGSATLLPMKFMRRWQWENVWIVYASLAYLMFPLLAAWFFIPELFQVYADAGWLTVISVVLFGFGWGLSVVMLGLAVAKVGLAVSTGIILGCSIAIGSLAPLLFTPQSLLTLSNGRIAVADFVVVAGVLLCARAGYLRDRIQNPQGAEGTSRWRGLLLCFVAGVLTPLLNLAFSAGAPITESALRHGAAVHQATNAVWGLAVSSGSWPSIVFCTILLSRNRTWATFKVRQSAVYAVLCLVMATCFIVSTIGYGAGAVGMGPLGPVIGWPIYISSIILGNSFWGWQTGEWREAPHRAIRFMIAGLLLQILGIVLLFIVAPLTVL